MATRTLSRLASPAFAATRFASSILVPNFARVSIASNNLSFQTRKYADEKLFVVKVPHLADSITEGTFKTWQKEIGEFVTLDEELGSIETDKVDIPINSPVSGIMKEYNIQNDENVVVGQNMCVIDTSGQESAASVSPTATSPAPTATSPAPTATSPAPAATSPAPTPAPVATTTKPAPAPAAIKPAPASSPAPATTKPTTVVPPLSTASFPRTENKVTMTRMRSRIAERLKQSQNTAASLSQFNELDMTNLINLRSTHKEAIQEKYGVKLGFMSAFVLAVTKSLMKFPNINARIEDNSIVYHDFVDMSVAVATPTGLVTPIVRNTESMNLIQIESEIARLGAKARDNKLTMEELTGGTFTISNGGVFGSMMGTPIINLPQSAIFGMHGIQKRPVAINDKIEIRPMMYTVLTYDHRIIDGRDATQFLLSVKSYIEDPTRFLFDL